MRVNLGNGFKFEMFELEQARQAEQLAAETNSAIYSWKSTESSNWLEKGLSIVDVLGITLLPQDMPEWISLPDDDEEEE